MRSIKFAFVLLVAIAATFGSGILILAGPTDQTTSSSSLTVASAQKESLSAEEQLKARTVARENAQQPIDPNDLQSINRSIKVEPEYKGDERHYYCLIFDDDQTQVLWMVFDGSVLYVDCNFNGDLTDKGEAFEAEEDRRMSLCSMEKISFTTERGQDVSLRFTYPGFPMRGGDPNAFPVRIQVAYRGATYSAWGDQTGEIANAKSPSDAPILRVNGPLQMGFEVSSASAVKRTEGDGFEVKAGVGTYGLGTGSFMHLKYWNDAIPRDRFPLAELEFPAEDKSSPNVVVKLKLKERC